MHEVNPLHFVNLGPGGTFRPSGAVRSTPADVDALVTHLRDSRQTKLAIHFHGGLIGERNGLDIAASMVPVYRNAGAHPLTVVWETGLIETVTRNLRSLNETRLFNKLVNYAIRHAIRRLAVEVPGRGPGELVPLGEVERLRGDPDALALAEARARSTAATLDEDDLAASASEIAAEIAADLAADTDIDAVLAAGPQTDLAAEPGDPTAAARSLTTLATVRHIAQIVFRTIRRFVRNRDHGVVATIVEETLHQMYLADLGQWVWGGMKQVARDMWAPNDGPIGDDSHVGSYLLDRFAGLQAQTGIELHVVGHSAGSIAICHMLSTIRRRHPRVRVSSIALLAPACRSDLFAREVVGSGRERAGPRIRVFTMHDNLERADRLVGPVYPHSLLYFISGCLEGDSDTPLVGLDRHIRGDEPYHEPPVSEVARYLQPDNRLVLSTTGDAGPGLSSNADSHTTFDDEQSTRASLTAWVAE